MQMNFEIRESKHQSWGIIKSRSS